MLAPDGRCKALDSTADGYVRSEAAVVFMLEVATFMGAACMASPDSLMLAGTAVNQDGRSSSLTAPHGPSQQAVIFAATADSVILPHELSGVEMHGTGGHRCVMQPRSNMLFQHCACISRIRACKGCKTCPWALP